MKGASGQDMISGDRGQSLKCLGYYSLCTNQVASARTAGPTLQPEAARRWQSLSAGTAASFWSCRNESRGRVGRAQ